VTDCCSPRGYRRIFSERNARLEADRYRRKGLDEISRRIVEFLKERGVEGRSVLEIGGGIGGIQLELLKAGAARSVSIELTPTYEEAAGGLLREAGLEDRVERRISDFAETAAAVEPADIVVMNRVVCCYPDMPKLIGAAADHAREVMVLSFPRRTLWTRLGLPIANFALWAFRREFHIFLHPPAKILASSEEHGLRTVSNRSGLVWTVAALQRSPA
jgi:hypothetical protein